MLNLVEHVSTSQAIVDQLIALIKRGVLKPGDRLPSENELMEMLGVGRSSIREAKQTLMAMNLVEAHPGRGSFIREIGPEACINPEAVWLLLAGERMGALYETRELLEVQVARLVAERATDADLQALEKALEQLEHAVCVGESVYDAGLQFHFALIKAAHNPVLVSLYDVIMGLLQECQRPIYEQASDPQAELEHHRQIYRSVRDRDPAQAERVMRQHLQYVKQTTKQGMPEFGVQQAGLEES
jgi:GntR family transcriptional repressor for pyruvate dehydrogenase complex